MEVAPPATPGANEQFMHKNRLQEHAQRCAIPLPLYQTVNEGFSHAPQFRSSVVVDGVAFRSSQTFAHRKEAEQDVAKIALEGLSRKIQQEGFPLIYADTMFCKSILHEYSMKMNLDKPTYASSKSEGLLPMFVSSVSLGGNTYKGMTGRNKKQAEQLAARAAVEAILGNSNLSTRSLMSQIIKSKGKLYSAVYQVNASNISPGMNTSSRGNIESLFENNLLDGKHVQAALINETSLDAVHAVGCASGLLSEEKQLKSKGTCELNSSVVGSRSALQHQPQAGPPSQQVSTCCQTVSDEPHLRLHSQVENETSSADLPVFPNETQGTSSSRKRKHSKMGKEECESN